MCIRDSLINDLMELSRLQSGQLSLKLESVKLNPLLDDLAEKYHSKACLLYTSRCV